jgi:hypothetical protein
MPQGMLYNYAQPLSYFGDGHKSMHNLNANPFFKNFVRGLNQLPFKSCAE